jgi:Phage integrase family
VVLQPERHAEDLHEIEPTDLLKFSAFLRDERDQSPQSFYNKFATLMAFLKANGIRGLVGKNDWPRYTTEEPEMYEQAELDMLFKACDPEEQLWCSTKFRSTFATRYLWEGVDLRTVQQWLGHSDMESTMHYLKPSRSARGREKVNQIFG